MNYFPEIVAAGIAHEINNPLAIISTQASQLQRYIDPNSRDAEKISAGLKKIEKTSYRIGKIISGLKIVSRNASADPKVEVNVYSIIQETLEFCKARLEYGGVVLSIDCPPHILINCKSSQISQVILNLLNNAFDAIIDLDEKWINIKVTINKGIALIAITDSGKGLSPEVVQKLMQPFFTTKSLGKGTGLGLSIPRKIIE